MMRKTGENSNVLSYKERLIAFFSVLDVSRLPEVYDLLRQYRGLEELLFKELAASHGLTLHQALNIATAFEAGLDLSAHIRKSV